MGIAPSSQPAVKALIAWPGVGIWRMGPASWGAGRRGDVPCSQPSWPSFHRRPMLPDADAAAVDQPIIAIKASETGSGPRPVTPFSGKTVVERDPRADALRAMFRHGPPLGNRQRAPRSTRRSSTRFTARSFVSGG